MNNQVNECFQQISVLNFFRRALNLMIFSGRITCPVESFLKYQSKLNKELPWLWQRPADSFYPDHETWFQKSPLGKNTSFINDEQNFTSRRAFHGQKFETVWPLAMRTTNQIREFKMAEMLRINTIIIQTQCAYLNKIEFAKCPRLQMYKIPQ